jgi:rubrerythrin
MNEAMCNVALAALEQAMENERQGEAFYQDLLEHVDDPAGREVFQTLADEEVEHVRVLQAEYEAIQRDHAWMALNEARTCEPLTPLELFPEKMDSVLAVAPKIKDEDALKMAMGFEEKGYNSYCKSAQETSDPEGKKVFEFLAKQENAHFVFLQKTLDYLTNQGAWYFDDQEFPFFDGAS